jgi:PhnB protein
MQLNPHLSFNGNCEEAFRFYEKCLRGNLHMMMTYGSSPPASETPPPLHGKIAHATLVLGNYRLTGGDAFPERYQKPQGLSVLLNLESTAEAERIFSELAENGTVQMPLQQTFFARKFGEVTDQFGTPWTISCH